MQKINFSNGWRARRLDSSDKFQEIIIPHDAMITEKRSDDSMGGHNIGYFEAHDYEYQKSFFVSDDDYGKHFVLEFEGVYHQAVVYLNGQKIAFRPYGYTNFFIELDSDLKYGKENLLEVVVQNRLQPNSRWYTGTGIYRPVNLYIGEQEYITENGIQIKTLSINKPTIELTLSTVGAKEAKIEILDDDQVIKEISYTIDNGLDNSKSCSIIPIVLPEASLWSADKPKLYQAKVTVGNDEVIETFGIRTVELSVEEGLLINGKREILRGACIHHDNGMLGACAFPESEERKIRIMKDAGYNAIRSAHNPCSKALLEACDRIGMYVLDEYLDGWYIHKTQYDYALYIEDWWQKDLDNLVSKDYNHPSVIMYSLGNEVSETAEPKGIQLTKTMRDYLHQLDNTRPVTTGVNIFFNFLSSIGLGVYSDEKSQKEVETKVQKKKTPVGSEFYNTLAGMVGADFMKLGATLYPCDLKTRDAFASMDVAGYNYGILRYKKDLKKYPNRIILGTETFCSDAYDFWEFAKKNPRIIGDFVWAGMDYLGETSVGAWVYPEYKPEDAPEHGWLTAGSGRYDILGLPVYGEAAYTKVAFEQVKGPLMAVKPLHMQGKHSPSAWKMTDALNSWTFPGSEGKMAEVEVYSRQKIVRLFVNGRQVGAKMPKSGRVIFKTPYVPGVIKAKEYDKNNQEIGEVELRTADNQTQISLFPETKAYQDKLLYIPIAYTDQKGIVKPTMRGRITVEVEGAQLLALGHACPYNIEGYRNHFTDTYYGQAMAILKVIDKDEVIIKVTDGKYSQDMKLDVEEMVL